MVNRSSLKLNSGLRSDPNSGGSTLLTFRPLRLLPFPAFRILQRLDVALILCYFTKAHFDTFFVSLRYLASARRLPYLPAELDCVRWKWTSILKLALVRCATSCSFHTKEFLRWHFWKASISNVRRAPVSRIVAPIIVAKLSPLCRNAALIRISLWQTMTFSFTCTPPLQIYPMSHGQTMSERSMLRLLGTDHEIVDLKVGICRIVI